MNFSAIEIFALIFILFAIIKISVILINPKSWARITKRVWVKPFFISSVCFILAGIVLYYLIQELTIVQIVAVMLFVGLLAGMTIAIYSNEVIVMASKLLKDKKILRKAWFSILIWAILIVWTIFELFW